MTREDALKQIREWDFLNDEERAALETLIPELRESEDERIRKEIIDIVEAYRANCVYEGTHHFDECLAWLEKQKDDDIRSEVYGSLNPPPKIPEQKPVKHPKMVEMLREHLENTPKEQLDVEFEELKNWNDVGPTVEEFFHGKPIEWNEKDEKMRACAISLLQISRDSGMAINPGFGKPVRAINKCIDWLKSLRPVKQEWNEEDEMMLASIISTLKLTNGAAQMKIDWLENRVKSLRPSWKPSEEQMLITAAEVGCIVSLDAQLREDYPDRETRHQRIAEIINRDRKEEK